MAKNALKSRTQRQPVETDTTARGAGCADETGPGPTPPSRPLPEILRLPKNATATECRELHARAKDEMRRNIALMRSAKPSLLRRNSALRGYCHAIMLRMAEINREPASATATPTGGVETTPS